jgi:hypothetical protein
VKGRMYQAMQVPRAAGLVAFVVALTIAGCGGDEEWKPSGVGPSIDQDTRALADPMAGATMGDDLRGMPAPTAKPPSAVESVRSALSSGDGTGGSGGTATPPRVLYLFYATGKDLPDTDINACSGMGTPPKFNCTFASTLVECQHQVQAYLDKWWADFNIVFTLTRPTYGKFYSEVVSSGGGAWCNVAPNVAGVAPFLCDDIDGGVAYTFLGGMSAHQTAVIISQEAAHLVGLEHVTDSSDIMYPQICSDCDGFEDKQLPIDSDRCDRGTQDSYQMLKQRLGSWPGGPKPSAFGCTSDTVPPTVQILTPTPNASVANDFSLSVNAFANCGISEVQVDIEPQGLKATSYAPPFEWDLANISGHQTITVSAIDGMGLLTKASVSVTAPMKVGTLDVTAPNVAGCAVASSAYGLAGALPALAMLALFSRRRRAPARRRRAVTGVLGQQKNV